MDVATHGEGEVGQYFDVNTVQTFTNRCTQGVSCHFLIETLPSGL